MCNAFDLKPDREPWNKGKLIGQKPPLQPKHVWAIRTRLQLDGRLRELALFNLAIDSKLRACCGPQGPRRGTAWLRDRARDSAPAQDRASREVRDERTDAPSGG